MTSPGQHLFHALHEHTKVVSTVTSTTSPSHHPLHSFAHVRDEHEYQTTRWIHGTISGYFHTYGMPCSPGYLFSLRYESTKCLSVIVYYNWYNLLYFNIINVKHMLNIKRRRRWFTRVVHDVTCTTIRISKQQSGGFFGEYS